MHQQIRAFKTREEIEFERLHILHLEQDYELLSLHQALEQHDNKGIIRSKQRLKEIHEEMVEVQQYI